MKKPIIGIVLNYRDHLATSAHYDVSVAYSQQIAQAGGVPIMIPHETNCLPDYFKHCDAFVLTGGVDPDMASFGKPLHPKARPMDPARQAFELSLLKLAQTQFPDKPILGICLGMQMMALFAGGDIHQYLPDIISCPELHQNDHRHPLVIQCPDSVLCHDVTLKNQANLLGQNLHTIAPNSNHHTKQKTLATVVSWHRQAVSDAGQLRVIACAEDGVIEAIDDPKRRFYVGVQWHPERGGKGDFNASLLKTLVQTCEAKTSSSTAIKPPPPTQHPLG